MFLWLGIRILMPKNVVDAAVASLTLKIIVSAVSIKKFFCLVRTWSNVIGHRQVMWGKSLEW